MEHAASAIVGGVPDGDGGTDAADGSDAGVDPIADAVVAIALDDGHICSGTLVAPDIVLTARHCVSNTTSLESRCTADGEDTGAAQFSDDKPPSTLRIFVGRTLDLRRAPAALGKKALYADASVPCNTDLALLVLDRRVAGPKPLPVRLYGPTRSGETLRAIGYGRTETGSIGERRHRDNVRVLASGPTVSASQTALGSREIETSQSFCDGDSGGPALSEAGAVIGVASRGPECTEAAGYVYTTVTGFGAVFDEAKKLTDSAIALEPGDAEHSEDPAPDPPALDQGDGRADAGTHAPSYDRGLPASCSFAPPGRAGQGTASSWALALALTLIVASVRRALSVDRRSVRDPSNMRGIRACAAVDASRSTEITRAS
ncbi:MAG: hypothetical protein JWP87_772 [Labilithrix sp.]|nr:hypothetical protein [Labilithrix sp.]